VLALVAGPRDYQPRPNNQQQTPLLLSQQLMLLSMTANVASEMHFNTLCSLTQPYLADCILYLMQYLYDPGILPSSANDFKYICQGSNGTNKAQVVSELS